MTDATGSAWDASVQFASSYTRDNPFKLNWIRSDPDLGVDNNDRQAMVRQDELKPASSSHAPYAVAAVVNIQLSGPLSLIVPSWHIDTLTRMSTRLLTSLLH